MTEPKMTAEEALDYLVDQHMAALDIGRGYECLEIIRTELAELRAERDKLKVSRDLHEQLLKEALVEAEPFFQCGGRYAHWLVPGFSIFKGIGVLAEKYEAAQAELDVANETIERERSLRSDVIAQRDAFREQNKVLKQVREDNQQDFGKMLREAQEHFGLRQSMSLEQIEAEIEKKRPQQLTGEAEELCKQCSDPVDRVGAMVMCDKCKTRSIQPTRVTGEADGWCAESPEGELQKQLYSSNEDMGWSSLVGINSRSPEPYLVVQATRKLVADGWRVVPVKIVKVGEAQSNSSETMRDEN